MMFTFTTVTFTILHALQQLATYKGQISPTCLAVDPQHFSKEQEIIRVT
jgi:hypothetical protein